ncbi:MAG TPA: maleylpyruvate isomerase family mycothiol-dependent enzyme, partial [Actinomycetota bacterium]|nr:maleylpyruvate isomerase family mycothiol-dependent enzyme [Actinomycetota bacterium]
MTTSLVSRGGDIASSVRAQRSRTIAMLEDLTSAQWEVAVTPGWRVREVAAHLVATDEAALTGRLWTLGVRRVDMERIERWNDVQVQRWAGRPIPALLHALDRWGRRIARATSLPGPLGSKAIPTPLGKVSLQWLAGLRVYDEWVHGEDVRRALGLPSDDDPSIVEPVARQLLATIPVQTLPRVPHGARGEVTIAFSDVAVEPLGIDLGRKRYGSILANRGTRIEAEAAALVMCAARRDAWREVEAD